VVEAIVLDEDSGSGNTEMGGCEPEVVVVIDENSAAVGEAVTVVVTVTTDVAFTVGNAPYSGGENATTLLTGAGTAAAIS
jgi:hypothetical protein